MSDHRTRHAAAVNAVDPAIAAWNQARRKAGWIHEPLFVPLSLRVQIAEAVLAAVEAADGTGAETPLSGPRSD